MEPVPLGLDLRCHLFYVCFFVVVHRIKVSAFRRIHTAWPIMKTNVLSILVWLAAGLVPAVAQGSTADALAMLPTCAVRPEDT
jgi:hypothetical protein